MPRVSKKATAVTNGTVTDTDLDLEEVEPEEEYEPVAVKPKTKGKITTTESILSISPPDFRYVSLKIIGTSVYCQHAFGAKALQTMRDAQVAGSAGKARKVRESKDFHQLYLDAMHVSTDGWCGIPSSSFRSAMITACRTVGVVMTRAKLAVFVLEDGVDRVSGEPLTKITKGEPYLLEMPVRNATGVADIRARPAWAPGWEAIVCVEYDGGMITASDIVNLMMRVGVQVGIGEGRPSSKMSNGLGWGRFRVEAPSADEEENDDI